LVKTSTQEKNSRNSRSDQAKKMRKDEEENGPI